MDDPSNDSPGLAAALRELQRLDRLQAAERAELEERQRRDRAALLARIVIHGSPGGRSGGENLPPLITLRRPNWVRAAKAFRDRGFRFDDWMIRRICQNHPEWACLLPGGWHVDLRPFRSFADRVERGAAKFVTTTKAGN